jgi:hypothetical protein
MPLNPRCIACGENAPVWKYRPYCSESCNPEKKTAAKPEPKKDK